MVRKMSPAACRRGHDSGPDYPRVSAVCQAAPSASTGSPERVSGACLTTASVAPQGASHCNSSVKPPRALWVGSSTARTTTQSAAGVVGGAWTDKSREPDGTGSQEWGAWRRLVHHLGLRSGKTQGGEGSVSHGLPEKNQTLPHPNRGFDTRRFGPALPLDYLGAICRLLRLLHRLGIDLVPDFSAPQI